MRRSQGVGADRAAAGRAPRPGREGGRRQRGQPPGPALRAQLWRPRDRARRPGARSGAAAGLYQPRRRRPAGARTHAADSGRAKPRARARVRRRPRQGQARPAADLGRPAAAGQVDGGARCAVRRRPLRRGQRRHRSGGTLDRRAAGPRSGRARAPAADADAGRPAARRLCAGRARRTARRQRYRQRANAARRSRRRARRSTAGQGAADGQRRRHRPQPRRDREAARRRGGRPLPGPQGAAAGATGRPAADGAVAARPHPAAARRGRRDRDRRRRSAVAHRPLLRPARHRDRHSHRRQHRDPLRRLGRGRGARRVALRAARQPAAAGYRQRRQLRPAADARQGLWQRPAVRRAVARDQEPARGPERRRALRRIRRADRAIAAACSIPRAQRPDAALGSGQGDRAQRQARRAGAARPRRRRRSADRPAARGGGDRARPGREARTVIRVAGLSKRYPAAGGGRRVLEQIDLTVAAGTSAALLGTSGAGKTTLLNILGGLDLDYQGEVEVAGLRLRGRGDRELSRFRRDCVGFMFQDFHLLEHLSALDNVLLASRFAAAAERRQHAERARQLLSEVGLAGREDELPGALSGGERQRVALARALLRRPRVILADEPTGNLDPVTGQRLMELLARLLRDDGATLLIATHDESVACRTDRRWRLEGGRLLDGATGDNPDAGGARGPA
ncbi:MAG: ABC transporter ATP-binding protein [Deltaproteobacteria bacterium]|nr:ABC transporter ATP-binding protein [Deltaproteobacteria bacterium]